MEKKITPVEKGVLAVALIACAIQLGLIAYSAAQLGIAVPGCVTNVAPFTEGKLIPLGPNRYEVHMLARMWGFEPNVLRIPKGSTVDFYLTSQDITHGFYIDRTNVNLMAIPNVVNYAQARFKETGQYPFLCHEYCGAGHHEMNGLIEVANAGAPASAEGIRAAGSPATQSEELPGKAVLQTKGCMVCHSLDGSHGLGPTFKGVWGRHEDFADGTSIASVNAPYIKESILDPQKKIIKGFGPIMPKLALTDVEIQQIIDYLKTLQ